jgi:hypothetical protein
MFTLVNEGLEKFIYSFFEFKLLIFKKNKQLHLSNEKIFFIVFDFC